MRWEWLVSPRPLLPVQHPYSDGLGRGQFRIRRMQILIEKHTNVLPQAGPGCLRWAASAARGRKVNQDLVSRGPAFATEVARGWSAVGRLDLRAGSHRGPRLSEHGSTWQPGRLHPDLCSGTRPRPPGPQVAEIVGRLAPRRPGYDYGRAAVTPRPPSEPEGPRLRGHEAPLGGAGRPSTGPDMREIGVLPAWNSCPSFS
jgi:hypothetical protein